MSDFIRGLSLATILTLGIGVIFLSEVIPTAFDNFFAANTTGWDATTVALWVLIPTIIIAAIVLYFMPRSGGKGA